jgi:hypothetical protein
MAQTSSYLALIPSANAGKPNFAAMVACDVQMFVDIINFCESMVGSFALGVAAGAQLTVIGLWVGVSRWINIPIQGWFSFDTANFGWDQGVWWQPGEALTGTTALDDSTMLALIQAKILWNKWDGTTPTLYAIVAGLFPQCVVAITDNLNCSISVSVTGPNLNALLKAMAVDGLLPYAPVGISVSYTFH